MRDGLITMGNWEAFLTLEREELLLVQRKHVFVIALPILFTSILAFLLIFLASFFFLSILDSPSLFITTTLLLLSIMLSLIIKIIVDWYFHLYIVTTRKILEIWYTPLASYNVNDVLLDKVNCTEVDLRVDGFWHELVGMGDVVITFDRPTHEEDFILKDIAGSDKIEKFLSSYLMDHEVKESSRPIWYRRQVAFGR